MLLKPTHLCTFLIKQGKKRPSSEPSSLYPREPGELWMDRAHQASKPRWAASAEVIPIIAWCLFFATFFITECCSSSVLEPRCEGFAHTAPELPWLSFCSHTESNHLLHSATEREKYSYYTKKPSPKPHSSLHTQPVLRASSMHVHLCSKSGETLA